MAPHFPLTVEISNHSEDLLPRIRTAESSQVLLQLLRPNDERRARLIAQHAPASVIDDDFLDWIWTYQSGYVVEAFLCNDALEQLGDEWLAGKMFSFLDRLHALNYHHAQRIVMLRPGIVPHLVPRLEHHIFENSKFRRAGTNSETIALLYLSLRNEIPEDRLFWLADGFGQHRPVHLAIVYHPSCTPRIARHVYARNRHDQILQAVLRTHARRDPETCLMLLPKISFDLSTLSALIEVVEDPVCFAALLKAIQRWDAPLAEQYLAQRIVAMGFLEPIVAGHFLEDSTPEVREWMIRQLANAPTSPRSSTSNKRKR